MRAWAWAWACALLALLGSAAVAEPLPDGRRSGLEFMGESTQAMQRDDALNPGMLWVLEGEAVWSQPVGADGRSCAGCHGAARQAMRGVAARYPAFDTALQRPIDLRQRIASCRQKLQPQAITPGDAPQALALEASSPFSRAGCRSRRRPTRGWSRRAIAAAGSSTSAWASSIWPAAIATRPMPAGAWAAARSRRRTPPAIRSTGWSGRAWARCSAACAPA